MFFFYVERDAVRVESVAQVVQDQATTPFINNLFFCQ